MRAATARTCPVISSLARCRSRCMPDSASSSSNTLILLSSHVRLGTWQVFHPPGPEPGSAWTTEQTALAGHHEAGSRTGRLAVMTYSSVRGLHVQVPVVGALEYLRGWLDLGRGRLEDGVPGGCGPGRERLAEVAVTGVFGGEHDALPVGQLFGEYVVLGGQLGDPLGR